MWPPVLYCIDWACISLHCIGVLMGPGGINLRIHFIFQPISTYFRTEENTLDFISKQYYCSCNHYQIECRLVTCLHVRFFGGTKHGDVLRIL